jgi:hypothetical protein
VDAVVDVVLVDVNGDDVKNSLAAVTSHEPRVALAVCRMDTPKSSTSRHDVVVLTIIVVL